MRWPHARLRHRRQITASARQQRCRFKQSLRALLTATGCALLFGAAWGFHRPGRTPLFADAENIALVTQGKHLYTAYCASCHGRALQGQPLWQMRDESAHRRAPALDRFGPAWQQNDQALFRVVKSGGMNAAPGIGSAMPAFAATLSDNDILATIAFIKARWPIGLRVAQALLNPASRGTPRQASSSNWAFPPNCTPPQR